MDSDLFTSRYRYMILRIILGRGSRGRTAILRRCFWTLQVGNHTLSSGMERVTSLAGINWFKLDNDREVAEHTLGAGYSV